MGMFDSLYDAEGNEWQTKAFGRALNNVGIGDEISFTERDFQVRVLGEREPLVFEYGLATVRDGVLVAVPDDRDASLPLFEYGGNPSEYV